MKITLGFLCCFYLGISYAANPLTLTVDNSLTEFAVTLPSNPTTGYQWTLTRYDKTILHLVNSSYLPKQTGLIGSGGEMVFRFALNHGKTYPSTTEMLFRYARSWEKKRATLTHVTVSFTKK